MLKLGLQDLNYLSCPHYLLGSRAVELVQGTRTRLVSGGWHGFDANASCYNNTPVWSAFPKGLLEMFSRHLQALKESRNSGCVHSMFHKLLHLLIQPTEQGVGLRPPPGPHCKVAFLTSPRSCPTVSWSCRPNLCLQDGNEGKKCDC